MMGVARISYTTNCGGVGNFSELRQQVVTRADHALRDGHNMFLRGNWTGYDRDNTSFGELNTRNRGYYQNLSEFSLAFGDTFVISPRWVSETRLGFAYHDAGSTSYEPNGPSIEIAGFGNFGRDFFLPIRGLERVYQVRQNFIRVTDRQTLKFGADANPARNWVRSETFLSGRFIFGEAVPLASVIDNAAGTGTSRLIQGRSGRCRTGPACRCRGRTHFGSPGIRPRAADRIPARLRQSVLAGLDEPHEFLCRGRGPDHAQVPADSGPAPRARVQDEVSTRQQQPGAESGLRLEPESEDCRARRLRNLLRPNRGTDLVYQ